MERAGVTGPKDPRVSALDALWHDASKRMSLALWQDADFHKTTVNVGDSMELLFSTALKPMADFEVGEIGLCNFGRGAELAMLVVKLEEDLGFATMHDQGDDQFSVHYVEHRPDLCLSYGHDWKLVMDPTGDIQIGVYASPEIGDIVIWDGAHGLCASQSRGPMKSKINFPLTGTVSNRSRVEAVFKSWKIVLNETDPETGLAPVIFRHNNST